MADSSIDTALSSSVHPTSRTDINDDESYKQTNCHISNDNEYLNCSELLKLQLGGRKTTYDANKLRRSTIKSLTSHLNLLKNNEISLHELHGKNLNKVLNELRLSTGSTLSPGYKLQIGNSVMKALDNEAVYDPREFRQQRKISSAQTAKPEVMKDLQYIVEYSSRIIMNALKNNIIENLSNYDAALGVLLLVSALLRIDEIHQLTILDLYRVLGNNDIYIKLKNSKTDQRRIIRNVLLETVIYSIICNRNKAIKSATNNDNNRAKNFKNFRLKKKFVLLTSISQMNRSLHEFASLLGIHVEKLGFKRFRKFMVSMLVKNQASAVTQYVNMHGKLHTTIMHYYMSTTRQMGKGQGDIGSNNVETSTGSIVVPTMSTSGRNDESKITQRQSMRRKPSSELSSTSSSFIISKSKKPNQIHLSQAKVIANKARNQLKTLSAEEKPLKLYTDETLLANDDRYKREGQYGHKSLEEELLEANGIMDSDTMLRIMREPEADSNVEMYENRGPMKDWFDTPPQTPYNVK